jgi:bacterioferritin-associated ferredoxin
MILCVCNGLSERVIRRAIEGRPAPSVGELYRCLGCRVRCGKCVPYVAELARDARPLQLAAAAPADEAAAGFQVAPAAA